ncbi:hypothetical protein E1B28_010822 [Marasmius oreades]|uniref:DUF6533 domain-containing protein n=1 Tax=Marasmius oreades TaxID=181124 RepID=A0A9P7RU68_9AGAR|nr:uncharacterized protein E1B28_010822 [Marasmius oreades]KAG7089113.1 hypothetical protein E1B28_010822 [Marasmius oreades]
MADATESKATFKKIVGTLEHLQIISYIDVLNSTLLIYDVIINLPAEIEYIWMREWSIVTGLYILQRYLPLFDAVVLTLHHNFGENLSTHYCTLNYSIDAWSFFIGVMLSETILTIRVWAVWGRSAPVALGLIVFFLACWVPCSVLLEKFLSAIEFAPLPFPNFRGCFISGGNHILWVCWVLWMVYDTGTLVMILVPGIEAYRKGGRSELVKTIYQDGVMYYAFIFLCSMINVIVILRLPDDMVVLLSSFERVLHSLLTSRALLHIRQIDSQSSAIQSISQLQFAQGEHEELSSFSAGQQWSNTTD